MGLDIRAISKLRYIGLRCTDLTDCEFQGQVVATCFEGNEMWPRNFQGLQEGCYQQLSGSLSYNFHAGSYSGYNEWRSWLCETFLEIPPSYLWEHPEIFVGKPFYELINYADNEGDIGPIVSAKLFKDFIVHADKISSYADDWRRQKYHDWMRAFELGADQGVVSLR